MKYSVYIFFLAVAVIFACNNEKKDSVEKAREANEKLEATSDTASVKPLNERDAAFMVETSSSQLMEIEMGNMAQQKAMHTEVKRFGELMAKQHAEIYQEQKNIASLKKVTLPATMGDEQQQHVDELRKKSETAFDNAYMDLMVRVHKNNIRQYEKAADQSESTDVKSFAAKTLPLLRDHLDSAILVKKVINHR